MPKRPSFEIKKKILACLREKPLSYAELERKINTGFRTVKANCEELDLLGDVKIDVAKHKANGRKAHMVSITTQGIKLLGKLESRGR
jgi:predicted ArsR family transcriptional regulator